MTEQPSNSVLNMLIRAIASGDNSELVEYCEIEAKVATINDKCKTKAKQKELELRLKYDKKVK